MKVRPWKVFMLTNGAVTRTFGFGKSTKAEHQLELKELEEENLHLGTSHLSCCHYQTGLTVVLGHKKLLLPKPYLESEGSISILLEENLPFLQPLIASHSRAA